MALIASARLCFACLTTAKMISLRSLAKFIKLYTWSFSCGLSLSSLLDVLITSYLCYLLLRERKTNSRMNHILDHLMFYAFENGSLTCAAAFTSLICWLTMHTNLIFMAIHFVISKLYANSLLASLNARRNLQNPTHRSQLSGDLNFANGKKSSGSTTIDASTTLQRSQSMKKSSESDMC
jgi:multidrug efflux pump subunit AcrB